MLKFAGRIPPRKSDSSLGSEEPFDKSSTRVSRQLSLIGYRVPKNLLTAEKASELPEAPVCLPAHFSEPRRVPIDVRLDNGGAYWLVSEPPFPGVSFPYDVSKPWVATNTGIA